MRRIKRTITLSGASLAVLAVLGIAVFQSGVLDHIAKAAPTAEIYFTFDAGTGTITDYDEAGPEAIEIPSTIGGVAVETIGVSAFYGKGLTNVSIPNSVTDIQASAFDNNPLVTLEVGELGTDTEPTMLLVAGAFSNDTLESVTLGDSVLGVMQGSLSGLSNLTELTLGDKLDTIDSALNNLGALEELTIPDSVIKIYASFGAMNSLKSLTVGSSSFSGPAVMEITGGSFYGLSALESLTFGNSIDVVGTGSFSGFSQLSALDFGDSLRVMQTGTFSGIGSGSTITELTIPATVEEIGGGMFGGSMLQKLIVGNYDYDGPAHTIISNGAFGGSDITELDIRGTSLLSILSGAFSGNQIATLNIDNGTGVETIGNSAFSNNPLTSVTLGSSVKTVLGGAFSSTPIKYLSLGAGIETLEPGAFSNTDIETLVVDADITDFLTNGAFGGVVQDNGQYIRLYTVDETNPYGYVDLLQRETEDFGEDGSLTPQYAYIVNPAQITTSYRNSSNGSISADVTVIGYTREDYTIEEDDELPITGFLRAGDEVQVTPIAIDGYVMPAPQSLTLVSRFNIAIFTYPTPEEAAEEEEGNTDPEPETGNNGNTGNNGGNGNSGSGNTTGNESNTQSTGGSTNNVGGVAVTNPATTEEDGVDTDTDPTPTTGNSGTKDETPEVTPDDQVSENTGAPLPVLIGAGVAAAAVIITAVSLAVRGRNTPQDL